MVMSEEGGNLGYDRRIRNSDRDALTFAGCGEPSGKLFAPVGWFTLRRIVFRSVTGAHVASPDTAGDRVHASYRELCGGVRSSGVPRIGLAHARREWTARLD